MHYSPSLGSLRPGVSPSAQTSPQYQPAFNWHAAQAQAQAQMQMQTQMNQSAATIGNGVPRAAMPQRSASGEGQQQRGRTSPFPVQPVHYQREPSVEPHRQSPQQQRSPSALGRMSPQLPHSASASPSAYREREDATAFQQQQQQQQPRSASALGMVRSSSTLRQQIEQRQQAEVGHYLDAHSPPEVYARKPAAGPKRQSYEYGGGSSDGHSGPPSTYARSYSASSDGHGKPTYARPGYGFSRENSSVGHSLAEDDEPDAASGSDLDSNPDIDAVLERFADGSDEGGQLGVERLGALGREDRSSMRHSAFTDRQSAYTARQSTFTEDDKSHYPDEDDQSRYSKYPYEEEEDRESRYRYSTWSGASRPASLLDDQRSGDVRERLMRRVQGILEQESGGGWGRERDPVPPVPRLDPALVQGRIRARGTGMGVGERF
jgi:hypothetical protein